MSKKQIRFLFPLGLLLAVLVVLAGCRPSTALTQLVEALNALNPGTEETMTEEEQEEQETSAQTDPMDEERDDAKIEEMDILIGQLLENMDEEEAQEALEVLYSDEVEDHDWGAQEYDPDRVTDEGNETSALALYIRGQATRDESASAGGMSSALTEGTGSVKREGAATADGTLQSESVIITPDPDSAGDGNGGGSDGGVPALSGESGDGSEPGTGTGTGGEGGDAGSSDGSGGGTPSSSESTIPPLTGDNGEDSSEDEDEEEVHTEGGVAATGELAIAVSMLAGDEALCATSEDYKENEWISSGKVFPNDHSVALWSGDGSTSLTNDEFQQLLDLKPDLCLEISGSNTFTQEQVEKLDELGIRYETTLPGFGSAAKTEATMELLGNLLGEKEMWERYRDFCKELKNKVSGSKKMTMFIEGWDPDAEFYDGDALFGSGVAYIRIGDFRPLGDYLGYVNVTDNSINPYRCSYNNEVTQSSSRVADAGTYIYITPLFGGWKDCDYSVGESGKWDLVSKNSATWDFTWGDFQRSRGFSVTPSDKNIQYNSKITSACLPWLGYTGTDQTAFEAIITRDNATAKAIKESWEWASCISGSREVMKGVIGGETVYGVISYVEIPDSIATYYDIPAYIGTCIMGDYEIYVNPSGGVSDWVDGSPEGILETAWAGWRLQGGLKEYNVRSYIKSFYNKFYGYEPTDDEMTAILAGK